MTLNIELGNALTQLISEYLDSRHVHYEGNLQEFKNDIAEIQELLTAPPSEDEIIRRIHAFLRSKMDPEILSTYVPDYIPEDKPEPPLGD
jgi:inhibitor of KinA sporulation pathway (predicted exonuclease)